MLLVSSNFSIVEQGFGNRVQSLEQSLAVGFGNLEGEA